MLQKAEDEKLNGIAEKWPETGVRKTETEMSHIRYFFKMASDTESAAFNAFLLSKALGAAESFAK